MCYSNVWRSLWKEACLLLYLRNPVFDGSKRGLVTMPSRSTTELLRNGLQTVEGRSVVHYPFSFFLRIGQLIYLSNENPTYRVIVHRRTFPFFYY